MMDARDGRPLLMIDLAVPRDVAADVRDVPGVALYDVDDLQAVVRRNRAVRQAEARARRGDRRGGDPALRRVARRAGGAADDRRAARARQGDREQVVRENAGRWESRLRARPRARRGDRAGDRAAACCTSRRCGMKQMDDERVHVRMQVVRELFGLDETVDGVDARAAAGGRQAAAARRHRVLMRIGTRAAARWRSRRPRWSPTLLGGAEHERRDRRDHDERRPRRAASATSRAGSRSWRRRCWTGGSTLAVHSAKDVPAELPDGLALAAVPERVDPRDALCGAPSLDALPDGRARRHEQPAPRRRAARAATRPGGRRAARQRRHAPAQARRGRATRRSCSALAGLAATGPRDAAAARWTSWCPRPGRARWCWRRAPATRDARWR